MEKVLGICPKCGFVSLNEKEKFCPNCGESLIIECPNCGARIHHPLARFCAVCGVEYSQDLKKKQARQQGKKD